MSARSLTCGKIGRPFSGPIRGIDASCHVSVKRGIRPIPHAAYQAVFDGIDVNIIDVRGVVPIVADRVLPEASLPDAPLTSHGAHRGSGFGWWY